MTKVREKLGLIGSGLTPTRLESHAIVVAFCYLLCYMFEPLPWIALVFPISGMLLMAFFGYDRERPTSSVVLALVGMGAAMTPAFIRIIKSLPHWLAVPPRAGF